MLCPRNVLKILVSAIAADLTANHATAVRSAKTQNNPGPKRKEAACFTVPTGFVTTAPTIFAGIAKVSDIADLAIPGLGGGFRRGSGCCVGSLCGELGIFTREN
jgi:hypothetical protein